jgi:hypothetical protein
MHGNRLGKISAPAGPVSTLIRRPDDMSFRIAIHVRYWHLADLPGCLPYVCF